MLPYKSFLCSFKNGWQIMYLFPDKAMHILSFVQSRGGNESKTEEAAIMVHIIKVAIFRTRFD
jgi:hypothetical protein